MTLIPVEYHGIHTTGPEQFTCVLLRWAEQNRILPVWISPLAAAELDSRDNGFTPRRPATVDLLQGPLEGANGRADGAVGVGEGGGGGARHEGAGVRAVLGVQDQRHVHHVDGGGRRHLTRERVKEVARHAEVGARLHRLLAVADALEGSDEEGELRH